MQQQRTYDRIAQAIAYIQQNFQQQPQLDEVAAHIHLSPAHFQRLFTDWVGTSPKKFLQYTSIEYAKNILKQQGSVLDATFETGLSSTSRLHDLFIQIEGMTPAEYKQGGQDLIIHYSFAETLFGEVLVASTHKGICAQNIDHAKAARAVGTAIGSNPVAFLIPCHRVIQSTGLLGGYEWGTLRKTAMIGWEGAQTHAIV